MKERTSAWNSRKCHVTIITARIRSRTGRYCFHICLSVNISGEGVPILGGYPSQVLTMVGYPGSPLLGLDGGLPIPGGTQGTPQPGLDSEGTPYQGGTQSGLNCTPHTSRPGWGTPLLPTLRWGTPPLSDGVPLTWDGVTLIKTWPGYPLDLGWGTPPRQSSIASTCYTAGSMPLAFTQEDFLVCIQFQ